jgi:glutathione S-transferase
MPSAPAKPRVTLYGAAITPYTVKVMRALRWKRLPFTLVEPTRAEDYRRWSPKTGLLPVIEIGGERVADSSAILDLLDERFPDPPLLSSDPKVAREQRRLEAWVGETFFFYLFRWVRSRIGAAPPAGAEAESEGRGPLMRLGLIGPDGRIRAETFDTSGGGPGPEFERRLDDLEKLLGQRPFFFVQRLSRADLAVFSFVQGLVTDRYAGGSALLRSRASLWEHTKRVDRATGGGA